MPDRRIRRLTSDAPALLTRCRVVLIRAGATFINGKLTEALVRTPSRKPPEKLLGRGETFPARGGDS